MKIKLKLLGTVLLLVMVQISFAQNSINFLQTKASVAEEQDFSGKKYKIDPQPLLEKIYKQIGFDPAKVELKNSLKKIAWNFQVGTTVSWWAQSFKTGANPVFYQVPSTCQAVGNNCYIFVENKIWNESVTADGVAKVLEAFDTKTPNGSINTAKGIFQNDVDVFGNPPNIDGDNKIVILIQDIVDDNSPTSTGFVAGYFTAYNEGTLANSNQAEMIYIDGKQNDLTSATDLQDAMSTVAHEFQHCIHFNYIKSYTTFFNECFSLSAEIINGYPVYSPRLYASEPNHYLLDWRTNTNNVYTDYSRGARFGLYLFEQFGSPFFTNYLKNGKDGIFGVNGSLTSLGSSRKYVDVVADWFLANGLNKKTIKSEWGYNYSGLPAMSVREHVNPNVSYSGTLENFGVDYITFSGGKNITVKFTDKNNNGIKVKAIKYGSGNPTVEDVATGADYSIPDFGTTISKVTFAIYYIDAGFIQRTINYSYTATGTFEATTREVKYDNTEPVGFISLAAGDSIAVYFDAIAGGKLDSIRVAIRNLTPISGRILEYLGLAAKLGGKFLADVTATSRLTTTPAVINSGGEYPYAQPYPNWTGIDLRSFNISAGKSLVVEFPYEDPYPGKNRILATYAPSSGTERTPLYKVSSESWAYSGVSGKDGYSWIGLIRAYVTIGGTDIEGPVEILPSAFSLDQNYPNPFNPSTIISYNLPRQSVVQIKIYDAIGNEVRSLIDEEKSAGRYNIYWDGRNNIGSRVASGIYFYKINAGEFTQTKKMILMK